MLALQQARRPVVIHNGLFDLLFIYCAFEDNLPDTYAEWRTKMHALFPGGLYDTKLLASCSVFRYFETSVEDLYRAILRTFFFRAHVVMSVCQIESQETKPQIRRACDLAIPSHSAPVSFYPPTTATPASFP